MWRKLALFCALWLVSMATPGYVRHVYWNGTNEPGNSYVCRLKSEEPTGPGDCLTMVLVYPVGNTLSSLVSRNANGVTVDTFSTTANATETDTTNNAILGVFDAPNSVGGAVDFLVNFNNPIAATATVNGTWYTITTVGSTNWVAIGAASNTVGVVFQATGVGSGTGTATQAPTTFQAMFSEKHNIASSSIQDGTPAVAFNVGAGGAGTAAIASGTGLTTTLTGDLIEHYGYDSGLGVGNGTGEQNQDGVNHIVAAAGYTLLQTDFHQGWFHQYQVQGTAGATNPSCNVTSANANSGWISITRALKAGTAGTTPDPNAMRTFGLYHAVLVGTGATGNVNYARQHATAGNTFVVMASDPRSSIQLVGVAGTTSGAWINPPVTDANAPSVIYLTGGTSSPSEVLTFTLNDKAAHDYVQYMLHDVLNGGAFDKLVTQGGATTFGPGNSTPTVSITPGVPSGRIFACAGINTGPPDAVVTPPGASYLSGNFNGMGDLDSFDNGDLHAEYSYSTPVTQNWVFHNTVSTTGFDFALLSIGSGAPSYILMGQACL